MSLRTSSEWAGVIAEEIGTLPVVALRSGLFRCLDFISVDKFLLVYTLQGFQPDSTIRICGTIAKRSTRSNKNRSCLDNL
jgi:hypothetical protein